MDPTLGLILHMLGRPTILSCKHTVRPLCSILHPRLIASAGACVCVCVGGGGGGIQAVAHAKLSP